MTISSCSTISRPIERIRDELIKALREDKKDISYRTGYVDAVLDFYNELHKVEGDITTASFASKEGAAV